MIDGRDNDDIWQTVPVISVFRQYEPTEDGDPTMRTEARIAYDTRNLYVLVRSFDPRPDSILYIFNDGEEDWGWNAVWHDAANAWRGRSSVAQKPDT